MQKSIIIAATFVGLGAIAAVASDGSGQSILSRTRAEIRKLYHQGPDVTALGAVPASAKAAPLTTPARPAPCTTPAEGTTRHPLARAETPPLVSMRMLGAALDRIEDPLFGPASVSGTKR